MFSTEKTTFSVIQTSCLQKTSSNKVKGDFIDLSINGGVSYTTVCTLIIGFCSSLHGRNNSHLVFHSNFSHNLTPQAKNKIESSILKNTTLSFEQNTGQMEDNALFKANDAQATVGDGADEDGVTMFTNLNLYLDLTFGLPCNYVNTTGNTAHVKAWIDWNDGAEALPDRVEITTPQHAVIGSQLGWRIRISNQDKITPMDYKQM